MQNGSLNITFAILRASFLNFRNRRIPVPVPVLVFVYRGSSPFSQLWLSLRKGVHYGFKLLNVIIIKFVLTFCLISTKFKKFRSEIQNLPGNNRTILNSSSRELFKSQEQEKAQKQKRLIDSLRIHRVYVCKRNFRRSSSTPKLIIPQAFRKRKMKYCCKYKVINYINDLSYY